MIQDFRDVLAELVKVRARFMVVGAHALSAYGIPRATVHRDVWIEATPENAMKVWQALVAFGAPLTDLNIAPDDLTKPDMVAQLGLPPFRIDVLTGLTGITFDEAWNERIEGKFDDVLVPFIGKAAFVRNKQATGRLKDLADIEALGQLK